MYLKNEFRLVIYLLLCLSLLFSLLSTNVENRKIEGFFCLKLKQRNIMKKETEGRRVERGRKGGRKGGGGK